MPASPTQARTGRRRALNRRLTGKRVTATFEDGHQTALTLPPEGCSGNRQRRFDWGMEQLRRRHEQIVDLRVLYAVD